MHALPLGVNLAGYLDSTLGVGHVARQLRAALEGQGVAVASVGLSADSGGRHDPPAAGLVPPREATQPVNLLCVNPDGLEGARAELGAAFFEGRRTIGVWWWEADTFPATWRRAFDHVDEVWTGSSYVAAALAAAAPVPVLRMPMPVTVERGSAGREQLGLPEGFLFLCAYDYDSVLARKNPLGALGAFRRAFPDGGEAGLVLKSVGAERNAEAHARVVAAAAEVPGVHVIDAVLSRADKDALIAACDCYVSLHRSEGFGLALAEALLLERPVVATAYSGPLDFLGPHNAYLVDHELVPVGPGNEPYPEDARWAEPDLDHAARLMREVAGDPAAAARRARRGRSDLERDHSLAASGRALAARLVRAQGLPASDDGRPDALETHRLERRIHAEPPAPPDDAALGPLRRLVREGVLRAIRMQTTHQRAVDEELLATLRTLDERVQGLAAGQASLRARLEALERSRDEHR